MAATVSSPWAKPGAWALDSEEYEAELEQQQQQQPKIEAQPLADFPSLSAAAAAKPKKKKNKGQTIGLAEFSAFGGPKPVQAEPVGLTHEDRLVLPTGPRERTAEELDRGRLGGGFKSYGGDRGREESNSKWGSQRKEGGGFGGRDGERDRDAPSKADESDDWGAGKRAAAPERRERGGGGFFGSQSKADESDSWVSNKSSSFSSEGRRFGGFERERKVGFTNGGGADSDSWGRKREESNGGFERERKVGLGFNSNGGGADSGSWGRKREETNGGGVESTGRPRLNLQPRTLPVTLPVVVSNETSPVVAVQPVVIVPKPKGANPFGAARPREEVLAEKGQDWKEIDEKLESVKLKEKEAVVAEGESFGKRSFGMGNGRSGGRTEGAWRKPLVARAEAEARPQSAGNDESRSIHSEEPEPENEKADEN